MIKKGSVHSVGCYWRCHLPQNKCHCLPITQSCRFLLPVNEHSPHVKSPATTMCTELQQQVAKARQEHLLLWPPISRVKSFSKKNNTVVITKLLTDKTSKDLVLLIEWKISMRDYDHNYSECYFFSHQIQPPPPERSASELVPCISLGVWNLVAFSSSSNSSPSLKWWYQ